MNGLVEQTDGRQRLRAIAVLALQAGPVTRRISSSQT